jgi:hypothetical protein
MGAMVNATSYTKGATSFLSKVAVAFLLGLSLYSYHAQELLVCWLFLGLMFVALALIILVGVLGYYAGKCVVGWVSTTVMPTSALSPAELRLKTISDGGELK